MPQFDLIRSRKRKTVSIEVHRDQRVIVRAPHRMSEKEIRRLVVDKQSWIDHQKLKQSCLPQKARPPEYTEGSHHYFLGEEFRLSYGSVNRIQISSNELIIPEKLIQRSADESDLQIKTEQILKEWYRHQATEWIGKQLDYWQEHICHWTRQVAGTKLRYMRRYWGSCNSRGWLTFNIHLIKIPASLIDYVITHELCHLREMNHSDAFYSLQSSLMPDWYQRRQQIRDWELKVLP